MNSLFWNVIIFQSGTCTLREAVIVASVLTKNSIPMLHSAAAILKIAEADYNGANSIFLRALLDKKYALPYRVVDAVVFHFLRYYRLFGLQNNICLRIVLLVPVFSGVYLWTAPSPGLPQTRESCPCYGISVSSHLSRGTKKTYPVNRKKYVWADSIS